MGLRLAALDERVAAITAASFTVGVLLGPGERPWINGVVALVFLALAFRPGSKAPRRVIAGTVGMFFAGLFTVFAHHGLDRRVEIEAASSDLRGEVVESPVRAAASTGYTVRVSDGPAELIGRRVILTSSSAVDWPWGDRVSVQAKLRDRSQPIAPKFRLTTPALRRGAVAYGTIHDQKDRHSTASAEPATRLSTLLGDARGGEHLARWAKSGLHPWFEFEAVLLLALVAGFWLLGRLKSEDLAARAALIAATAMIVSLGATPGRLRLAVVLLCVLGPRCLSKRPPVLLCLSLSVVMVLLANPYGLSDVGFQLGFTALVGATRLAPALQAAKPWSLHRASLPLLWLLAILAAMTPLTARLFDQVGPATAVASGALLLLTLVATVPWMLDQVFEFGSVNPLIESCLAGIEQAAAAIHSSLGPVWTPSVLECILMYGLLTVAATPRGRGFKQVSRLHASLALVFSWVVVVAAGQWTTRVRDDAQLVLLGHPSGAVIARDAQSLTVLAPLRDAPWYLAEERHLANELKRRRLFDIDVRLSTRARPSVDLAFVVHERQTIKEARPAYISWSSGRAALPPLSPESAVLDFKDGQPHIRPLEP